jgi:hypothetical protein
VTAPLWLWPNLLSLDAPLVALVWQILFGLCFRTGVHWLPAILLSVAVWAIYAADRMLDAWRGDAPEPRHQFYRRYWRIFLPIWIGVVSLGGLLAALRMEESLLRRGVALSAAVVLYLGIVHLAPARLRRLWPKEIVVAGLFAIGASLETWPRVRGADDALTIVLFSCLCWINCRAIESWERRAAPEWPVTALAAAVAAVALLMLAPHRPILCCAETVSAIAFVWLDRSRLRLSSNALRVLADVALLSPLPLLPLAGLRL